MATRSVILAWRIPWTEEPGGLQSTTLQRVRHDWTTYSTIGTSLTLPSLWESHKNFKHQSKVSSNKSSKERRALWKHPTPRVVQPGFRDVGVEAPPRAHARASPRTHAQSLRNSKLSFSWVGSRVLSLLSKNILLSMLAFEALDNSPGPETGKPALGGKKKNRLLRNAYCKTSCQGSS